MNNNTTTHHSTHHNNIHHNTSQHTTTHHNTKEGKDQPEEDVRGTYRHRRDKDNDAIGHIYKGKT